MDWFIGLFNLSIDNTEQPDSSLEGDAKLQSRMTLLNQAFTYTLYLNICRSLFEKDKLLFSCLLTTKIMLGGMRLQQAHLRFLLTGATAVDLPKPNPFPAWLSDKAWGDLLEIDEVVTCLFFVLLFFFSIYMCGFKLVAWCLSADHHHYHEHRIGLDVFYAFTHFQ